MKPSSIPIIEEVDKLLESGLPQDALPLLEKLMAEEDEFEIALRYSLALKRTGKDDLATEELAKIIITFSSNTNHLIAEAPELDLRDILNAVFEIGGEAGLLIYVDKFIYKIVDIYVEASDKLTMELEEKTKNPNFSSLEELKQCVMPIETRKNGYRKKALSVLGQVIEQLQKHKSAALLGNLSVKMDDVTSSLSKTDRMMENYIRLLMPKKSVSKDIAQENNGTSSYVIWIFVAVAIVLFIGMCSK